MNGNPVYNQCTCSPQCSITGCNNFSPLMDQIITAMLLKVSQGYFH